jgi:hypothetical protein
MLLFYLSPANRIHCSVYCGIGNTNLQVIEKDKENEIEGAAALLREPAHKVINAAIC